MGFQDIFFRIEDVPQHRKKLLAYTPDNFIVNKCTAWRTAELQYNAALFLLDSDIEVLVALFQSGVVILQASGREDCE